MDEPLTVGTFLLWAFVILPLSGMLLYLAVIVVLHVLVGLMHLSDRLRDGVSRRAGSKWEQLDADLEDAEGRDT